METIRPGRRNESVFMKQTKFFLGTALVAGLALSGCADSESISTTTTPAARTAESGASAAGGINNGNDVNSGFGGVDQQNGPGGVRGTDALAPATPYRGGR